MSKVSCDLRLHSTFFIIHFSVETISLTSLEDARRCLPCLYFHKIKRLLQVVHCNFVTRPFSIYNGGSSVYCVTRLVQDNLLAEMKNGGNRRRYPSVYSCFA